MKPVYSNNPHHQTARVTNAFFFLLAGAVVFSTLLNLKQPIYQFVQSSFNSNSNRPQPEGQGESQMLAVSPIALDSAMKPIAVYENVKPEENAIVTVAESEARAKLAKEAKRKAKAMKASAAYLLANEIRNLDIINELSLVTDMHEFHFKKNSSEIVENAGIEKLDSSLQKYIDAPESYSKIIVLGFTDNRGTQFSNVKLGMKRAETLKALLVKKGIPAEKITVASFGSELPIGSNETNAGRERNRRVEFNVIGAGS